MAYKVRLYEDTLAPRLPKQFDLTPTQISNHLTAILRVIACQTGDHGAIAQVIAGLDIALWDLLAKQQNRPLAALLNPHYRQELPMYASGVDRKEIDARIDAARELGICGYKLKVGFDPDEDRHAIDTFLARLNADESLAIDANQGWTYDEAHAVIPAIPREIRWIEEPILADEPYERWSALQNLTQIPLSGGENYLHENAFLNYFNAPNKPFSILQPDACKWGGVTGVGALFPAIKAAGIHFYPHFLGSAVGLAASAHLLAAEGGSGLLEYDIQPNILRDRLAQEPLPINKGLYQINDTQGHGVTPDPHVLNTWCDHPIELELPN
jgi:D-galactarolactone cycloisomerase